MNIKLVVVIIFLIGRIGVLDAEDNFIFPAPMERTDINQKFIIDSNTYLVVPNKGDKGFQDIAVLLQEEIKSYCGVELKIKEEKGIGGSKGAILLGLLPESKLIERNIVAVKINPVKKLEGYVLYVDKNIALVGGADVRGVYYGVLTLLQRIYKDSNVYIAGTKIRDWPHFEYRAMRLSLPRGKPRKGETDKSYFKNFLRALSFFKMNYAMIEGFPWAVPLKKRPGLNWHDPLTLEEVKEINAYGNKYFLKMCPTIASAPAAWAVRFYPQLIEVAEGEDPQNLKTWGYRKGKEANRQNLCPSNEESYKLLFDIYDEMTGMFNGDVVNIGIDEVHHEGAGSRWAVCDRCKNKDPVKLFADFVNRLSRYIIKKGKTPIINSTVLIKEHGGYFKDLYKAADLIRKDVIISNWSETHIRHGKGSGKVEGFKSTEYFKNKGFKKIIHLVSAGANWNDREELKEVRGKLDAYGVVVAHYSGMNFETLNNNGTLRELIFSAENIWSPDLPAMGSEDEKKQLGYAYTMLREILLNNKMFMEAIEVGRAKQQNPAGKGKGAEFH